MVDLGRGCVCMNRFAKGLGESKWEKVTGFSVLIKII